MFVLLYTIPYRNLLKDISRNLDVQGATEERQSAFFIICTQICTKSESMYHFPTATLHSCFAPPFPVESCSNASLSLSFVLIRDIVKLQTNEWHRNERLSWLFGVKQD